MYQELCGRSSRPPVFFANPARAHAEYSEVMKVMSALVSLHSDDLASAIQKMRSNATSVDDAIKLAKEQDAAHEKSGKYLPRCRA